MIVHADGTVAACTADDEPNGCTGRDVRRRRSPVLKRTERGQATVTNGPLTLRVCSGAAFHRPRNTSEASDVRALSALGIYRSACRSLTVARTGSGWLRMEDLNVPRRSSPTGVRANPTKTPTLWSTNRDAMSGRLQRFSKNRSGAPLFCTRHGAGLGLADRVRVQVVIATLRRVRVMVS